MRQRFSHSSYQSVRAWLQHLAMGVLSWGAIASLPSPAFGVETITVELGPGKTSIQVSDLATFAETGHVPTRLELYQPVLTPEVQAALQNHLSVEPAIRDRFLADLMDAENGRPFAKLLAQVAPSLTAEDLQAALQGAEASPSGVTAISLLQALPGDTLTLNGWALLRLLSQAGLAHWEQTALGEVLNQELGQSPVVSLSTRFEPAVPGTYPVEKWSVSFRDHQRDRVIPIDLYWTPENHGPTVVLSHGFGADRHFLKYLAEHLSSHGLTVVALEHPGSNVNSLAKDQGAILPPHEFVERPQDVSFILDQLTELNQRSFFLRGRLNMDRVTLVGHSLGGYTGLVLAGGKVDQVALTQFCEDLEVGASSPADWFQCAATVAKMPPQSLADERITQLVLMNPLAGEIFGDDGLRSVKIPTLVVTSTSDGIASVSDQQLRPFNQLSGPRSLVAIIGGTHLSVGDPNNINPALTQVPFMPEHPAEETLKLRQYLNGTVLSFVMQQTYQARQYQPFLSPEYAQVFSTPALPLRYSDRLPSSVNHWLINRERLDQRLTPTFRSLASLLHLELIDVRYRLAKLPRETLTQVPIASRYLAAYLSRSPFPYNTAQQLSTREFSRPAE